MPKRGGRKVRQNSPSPGSASQLNTSTASAVGPTIDSHPTPSIEMASSLIPLPFHGRTTERAENWVDNFEAWTKFARISDEEQKIAAMTLLLRDSARLWIDSLNPKPTTFTQLSAMFRSNFKRDDTAGWRDVAQLWTIVQRQNQNVESFINEIEEKGAKCKADQDQLRICALNGLLPYLKEAVIMQDIKSLACIKRYAMLKESVSLSNVTPGGQVSSPDVESAIRRLESRLDEIQLRQMTSDVPRSNDRAESPRPRRVSFEVDDPSSSTFDDQYSPHPYSQSYAARDGDGYRPRAAHYPEDRRANYLPARSSPRASSYDSRGWQPPAGRRPSETYGQFNGRARRGRGNQARSYGNQRPGNDNNEYSDRSNSSTFDNNQSGDFCQRCGLSPRHEIRFCRSRNNRCGLCSKIGHATDLCFMARPADQGFNQY
jgi:Retrotransposon gag protein